MGRRTMNLSGVDHSSLRGWISDGPESSGLEAPEDMTDYCERTRSRCHFYQIIMIAHLRLYSLTIFCALANTALFSFRACVGSLCVPFACSFIL